MFIIEINEHFTFKKAIETWVDLSLDLFTCLSSCIELPIYAIFNIEQDIIYLNVIPLRTFIYYKVKFSKEKKIPEIHKRSFVAGFVLQSDFFPRELKSRAKNYATFRLLKNLDLILRDKYF